MAAMYEWKDPVTGEIRESTSYDTPPYYGWVRVFSFGVGAVTGAGSSPSRYVSSK
jgi:hypothetical protein